MLSAAAAYARPSLEVTEATARAGDLVHFSISGVDGHVTYVLEVGDKDVLQGAGGGVISAAFTVPDMGDAVRTVTVEAEIQGSDKRKKVKRKLEYLGPALPATGPPAPAPPPPVPAAVPQATPSPQPIYPPDRVEAISPAQAVTPASSRGPRKSRKRRAIESPRNAARSGERRKHARRGRDRPNPDMSSKKNRSKRPAPRTAPLFDGIPEPGAGAWPGEDGPNPIAPRKAVVTPTGARLADGGVNAAVVVPALLGLAALALAGMAALRRRQLASRPGRD